MRTRIIERAVLGGVFAFFGCGPQISVQDESDTAMAGSTSGAATSANPTPPSMTSAQPPGPATSSGGVGDTSTSGADESDEGMSFLPDPTGGCGIELPDGTTTHCSFECDIFEQDCPEDEKCMLWSNDGGAAFNATRCSPIADDPGQLEEACVVEGAPVSGLDDCDIGLACWGVDPETLEGTCYPLCAGSPRDPECPEEYTCPISGDGSNLICQRECNPLVDDDCEGDVCLPSNTGDAFVCVPPGGDAQPGGACEFINECVDGAVCVSGSNVPMCDDASCCTSVCDLSAAAPDADCLAGQSCVPWFEEPPRHLQDVGVCVTTR